MLFLVLKNCVPQRLSTIYMYHVNLYDPRKIYIIWGRWSQLVLNPSQQINKTSTNFFFLITFTGFAFKETRFLKWLKSYFEFFDNYEKQILKQNFGYIMILLIVYCHKQCKQTAMISSCSKLEIRWRGLWLQAMSMIDTSIKTYWIRIFIQNLTLYRPCSLEQQYVEKRKKKSSISNS